MSRVLRRARARREPLAAPVRDYLLTGEFPADHPPGWVQVWLLTTAQKRDLWREHRAELLAAWVEEHPGSRPWAFWYSEATEPRRVVDGAELLRPVRPGTRDWEFVWRQDFGVPCFTQCRPRGFVGFPTVEAEAAYLDRLGLLPDDERAQLDAEAFEPEAINPFSIVEGDLEE